MNKRKKLLIALSTLLIITSSLPCKDKKIKVVKNIETKQEHLEGYITRNDLKDYYVIEIIANNRRNLCLVNNYSLINIKTQNIISLEDIVNYYRLNNDVYTASDIEIILKKLENDYMEILEQTNVKKLELN